jgi:hypothetical protein
MFLLEFKDFCQWSTPTVRPNTQKIPQWILKPSCLSFNFDLFDCITSLDSIYKKNLHCHTLSLCVRDTFVFL